MTLTAPDRPADRRRRPVRRPPGPGLPQLRRHLPARSPSTPASSASARSRSATTPTRWRAVTREQIEAGPQNIWRYAALLPVGQDPADPGHPRPRHDPADPRRPAGRRARLTAPLWVKDDSANPTHSFKDRVVVSVALTAARALGFTRIACASTGNLANSVAAHAARVGMPSIVFVPADLEPGKIVPDRGLRRQTLVAIEGSYDDVNRLCCELAETDEFEDTAFVNVKRPAVLRRGLQDARLRGRRAARLAAPGAGGRPDGVRLAAHQGRQGVQGAGRRSGWSSAGRRLDGLRRAVGRLRPDRHRASTPAATSISRSSPTGIAKSLNIGNPADGPYALDAVRRTGGCDGRTSTTTRSAQGIRLLARTTGVFAETAGGVTVAVLSKLVEPAGSTRPGDRRLQHRRRSEDPRRGGRSSGRPTGSSRRCSRSGPPASSA